MTVESTEIPVPAPAELGQCLWALKLAMPDGQSWQGRCQLNIGHGVRPDRLYDHFYYDPEAPSQGLRVEFDEAHPGAFRVDLEELAARDIDVTQVIDVAGDDTVVIDAEIVEPGLEHHLAYDHGMPAETVDGGQGLERLHRRHHKRHRRLGHEHLVPAGAAR